MAALQIDLEQIPRDQEDEEDEEDKVYVHQSEDQDIARNGGGIPELGKEDLDCGEHCDQRCHPGNDQPRPLPLFRFFDEILHHRRLS
jgi:hypothetical protein